MRVAPNKTASGKGGITVLFHTERAWPALPEPERSAEGAHESYRRCCFARWAFGVFPGDASTTGTDPESSQTNRLHAGGASQGEAGGPFVTCAWSEHDGKEDRLRQFLMHEKSNLQPMGEEDIGMRRTAPTFLLLLTLLLAGCSAPDVKYADLQPATTATVAGDTVAVHLGSDLKASACWTRPKARVEGTTVYVVGYRTMREHSREFVVRLPPATNAQPVCVVWVDPDGSRVVVPITK